MIPITTSRPIAHHLIDRRDKDRMSSVSRDVPCSEFVMAHSGLLSEGKRRRAAEGVEHLYDPKRG